MTGETVTEEIAATDAYGIDRQADGGTHVRATGEVGTVRVVKTGEQGPGLQADADRDRTMTASAPVPATVRPSAPVMLARALLRRCPRCGQRGIFTRWFDLAPSCPRCGLSLEREEGYWLGAMAVNLGVTEVLFAALLITWAVLAWPDVPWVWLTVAGLALNAIVPILFYPFSKTIFLAIDLLTLHTNERAWAGPMAPASGPRDPDSGPRDPERP